MVAALTGAFHHELVRLRSDTNWLGEHLETSLEQVFAELATINQTTTAHAETVGVQLEKLNSAAADRNACIDDSAVTFHDCDAAAARHAEIDEALSTKLEAGSLVPIHVELAELRADKETLEQVKRKRTKSFISSLQQPRR